MTVLKPTWLLAGLLMTIATARAAAGPWSTPTAQELNAAAPDAEALYLDLHRHPELSGHEVETAAKLADRVRALGYEVTTGVGGNGVVAVLRNGAGRTVLLRTELDALPVAEKTGLPYASSVVVKNDAGLSVPVMHACGHDVHMSGWFGTAKVMAANRGRWHGTLVLIGQPAEEIGVGASAMIKDGLLTRFPRPDYALALHDSNEMPSDTIGYTPGYTLAAADSIDITIYGRGGHGGRPHQTIDPVVIAARTILALQTVVSRETNPIDPVVVTVGSIHGGTKHNIVPEEVHLQLSVRTFKPQVRERVLAAIERVTKAEAQAADAPRAPLITVSHVANATFNDPLLTQRIVAALTPVLGKEHLVELPPNTVSEDFSEFHLAGIPSLMLFVGGVEPKAYATLTAAGKTAPELHSAQWAPDYAATIRTEIRTETTALLDLLGR